MIPGAWIAWHYRSMPQAGAYHDDGVYLETAKSLAEGHGYRIPSLPDQPFQTKYPPVLPFLISLVWRMDPSFPSNLPKLTALCWSMLPMYLALLYVFLRRWGLAQFQAVAVCAITALSPHVVLASTMTMSEMTFGVLSLVALLCLERGTAESSAKLLVLASLAGGLAFLTRTQGITLLVSGVALLLSKKRRRNALAYGSVFSVAVIGWLVWTRTHRYQGSDPVTIYYVDYVRFYAASVQWKDIPQLLQINIDSILSSIGHLLFADLPKDIPGRMFGWVIAAASISGLRRLVKQSGQYHMAFYALLSLVMLLPWNWPPNERYLLPLWPAIGAGFVTEMRHLFDSSRAVLKRPEFSQKVAAVAILAFVAIVCCVIPYRNLDGTTHVLTAVYDDYQQKDNVRIPAYAWIRENTPTDAQILTYDDPLLYLYTGRRSVAMPIAHWLVDGGNDKRAQAYFTTAPAFMREHGLNYALLTDGDFRRDLQDMGRDALKLTLSRESWFEPLYHAPGADVFRIKPEAPGNRTPAGTWWASVRQSTPAIQ